MSKLERDLHSLERQQQLILALISELRRVSTVLGARRVLDRYLSQNLFCQRAVVQLLQRRGLLETPAQRAETVESASA